MKKGLILLGVVLSVVFVSCSSKQVGIEQKAENDAYEAMLQKPDFVFVPNNARPMSEKTINLNGGYSLAISPDTISAYLPYFGRAYSAPMNASEGGIKFLTTDFDLNQIAKKKGAYELKITPLDLNNTDLRGIVLYLSVSASGYADLRVQMTNKQPISFYGRVEERQ